MVLQRKNRLPRILLIACLAGVLVLGLWAYGLLHWDLSDWGRNDSTIAFQHYPTAVGLAAYVRDLAHEYPELVQIETIGYSLVGHPLQGVTIAAAGTIPPDARPALFIAAQQHAREAITSQAVAYFVQDILSSFREDPTVGYLLSTRTIYWVPQLNPDGNDHFLNANSRQRGNSRATDLDGDRHVSEDGTDAAGINTLERQMFRFSADWVAESHGQVFRTGWAGQTSNGDYQHITGYRSNIVTQGGWAIDQLDNDGDGQTNEDGLLGVDLNRNWDVEWDRGDASAASQLYRGSDPFSEPETTAVSDFVLNHPNIVAGLDVHSGTELILIPWSKIDEETPDHEILDQMARKGSQLTDTAHAVASQGLYMASGTLKDWLYQQGILALAPEIYGDSQFSKIVRLWPSNWYLTFSSLAEQFNPPPAAIWLTGERWKEFLLYMLSALPEANVSSLSLNGRELSLTCTNTGLVALDLEVELWRGGRQVATQRLSELSDETGTVTFTGVTDGGYLLRLRSQPVIAIKRHAPFWQELQLTVASDRLLQVSGVTVPPDLGQPFAGLTAPAVPYESEQWHLR